MLLIGNSFDSWQKDAFFPAAEEVQQSADIMESVYRTWQRMKKVHDQSVKEHLNTFCRDLQTALGTTKWQLDEFERAVSSLYMNTIDDASTTHMLRHRQFIDAIKTQVLKVETELRDCFTEDGKRPPLRWVHLDEDDCEDLAAFLSGSVATTQIKKDGYCSSSSSHDIELEDSPVCSSWKLDIVVDGNDDDERKHKERGFNCLHQIIGQWRRHRNLQTHLSFQFPSSRFMFVLLLIVFLMVPFLLLSSKEYEA